MRSPFCRWFAWSLYIAALTTALLLPVPIHGARDQALQQALNFFSKAVHVSSFAVLTALTVWLPVRPGRRWLFGPFLVGYAMLTEYLQYVMDVGRVGCWLDVGFNLIGMALGLLLTIRWWWPATISHLERGVARTESG